MLRSPRIRTLQIIVCSPKRSFSWACQLHHILLSPPLRIHFAGLISSLSKSLPHRKANSSEEFSGCALDKADIERHLMSKVQSPLWLW